MPRLLALTLCAILSLGACSRNLLQAAEGDGKEEEQSKVRLKLMEETIAGFEAASGEKLAASALAFVPKPLLRYSDPTRGTTAANVLLDAGVWRLGAKGRPTALVTLEIYRGTGDNAILAYEFLSLAETEFSLSHKRHEKVAWEASAKGFTMNVLTGSAKPAATTAARLVQMRQLARRFTVKERIRDVDTECRLLSQPIDRYRSAEAGIVDGALFVYANGTNPEIGVFVEASDAGWTYGIARLSSAEAKVSLDGKEVASFLPGDFGLKRQGNYVSTSHPIKMSQ